MAKKINYPTKNEAIQIYQTHFPVRNKKNDETIQKMFADEPIFPLRAMDETAPLIILDWIRENLFSASEDKLRSAFEQALAMKRFEDKRRAT